MYDGSLRSFTFGRKMQATLLQIFFRKSRGILKDKEICGQCYAASALFDLRRLICFLQANIFAPRANMVVQSSGDTSFRNFSDIKQWLL